MNVVDPKDPAKKARLKASIAAAIVSEIGGSSPADVVERVEKEYERLLVGAVVSAHIPALTGGRVRHALRVLFKGRRAASGMVVAHAAIAEAG